MRTRFLSVGVAWGLSILVALGHSWGAAGPAGRDPAESRQYSALLEEAVSEYDARRYEEARALFKKAHEISPNARTLRGIGMASFELREYVEALRALEGALSAKRRPLTSTQRQQVQSLADRARAFVGRFVVALSPREAVLHVDGAPAILEEDGSLLLSFGHHQLIAEAPGRVAENREVSVIGGERQSLDLKLAAINVAIPHLKRVPAAGVLGARPGERPSGRGSAARAGWWFAGAGLLAVGAVGSFFWWRFQQDEVARCDRAGVCHNRGVLIDRERIALGAMIGGVAGALALGTIGTVVWAKNGKTEPGAALACGPALGAVNCELKLTF